MTALEFVKREFNDTSKMTEEDWLRKMSEFQVIKNLNIVDLEQLLELSEKEKTVIQGACGTLLKCPNRVDLENELYSVIAVLSGVGVPYLDEAMIRNLAIFFDYKNDY